jgi:NAD(P)-dependent dehydrogenase (short-subunit alcohol dehydrogenase family)
MATVVITGCNRGIGLELCRQYVARGDTVIGVCRSGNNELEQLGMRVITGIDVAQDDCIERLRDALNGLAVDVLVNNAGILAGDALDTVDFETMIAQYQVNTLGPLRVTRALLDSLSDGSKVVIVTSRVGSIEDNASGNNYGYRASKTAVNQVGMNLKHDLLPRNIAVTLLHPGLVATDMTGGHGVSPEISARGLIARIDELNLSNSGRFWHAEGYELPW